MLISIGLFNLAYTQGNAEVSRRRNLQNPELERTTGADLIKLRNQQPSELERTMNVDLLKLRNYQYLELTRTMSADVIQLRNYQNVELIRIMNADITKLRNTLFFEMTEPGQLIVDVGSIMTTDQDGNPKATFNKGEIVQFEFVIANAGNLTLTRGLVSTMILDPSNTPVYLSYTFEDLASGASKKFIMGYGLPLDSPTGTYTVKVMVFTDWPSKGGIGLDVETSPFNVIA